jgi:hypothetical protein
VTTAHSAMHLYREATKHLRVLSERQQILTLKFELFHALQRGNDFQDRSRALEIRIARLEAAERETVLDEFARKLHADLQDKTMELENAQREHDKEARDLRLALQDSSLRCVLLDELCGDLVATLERAAADHMVTEVAESPATTEAAEGAAS